MQQARSERIAKRKEQKERKLREKGHTVALYAGKLIKKLAFPTKEDCGKVARKKCAASPAAVDRAQQALTITPREK
jgi:hypothetical protein